MSTDKDLSSNRDPETVELFIEESLEGLMRVERLLLAAERGQPNPDMMTVLFRDFHTIKGTSGFLDLKRILRLSHRAEDLLSPLPRQDARANSTPLRAVDGGRGPAAQDDRERSRVR